MLKENKIIHYLCTHLLNNGYEILQAHGSVDKGVDVIAEHQQPGEHPPRWAYMCPELSFEERKINVLIEMKENRRVALFDPSQSANRSRLQTALQVL